MGTVGEYRSLEALRGELDAARTTMVELLGRIDDISLREIPLVKIDYALKVGVWETERAKCELAARRAKRRCEMVQARVNRGLPADMASIEEALDEELRAWSEQVGAKVASLRASMQQRAAMGVLDASQARRLKKLHRKLVMRLHPDLNPGDGEASRMFSLVQIAYEKGDLEFLESLEVATAHMGQDPKDESPGDEDSLYVDLELARAQVSVLEERLEQLGATEPYVFRDLLGDPAWVESRVAPLKRQIEELQVICEAYEQRVAALKEEE